ncbi:hypothetical protein NDU88_011410 [Pleurodeles waltl]|uniref:Uncharacterized protein n=1 Tax=Pleurodeles waltl TaxID=8319 RepID=A0AAV7S423_PLEWA|nr:hypothetical protein NDU88_011410 [Pleurodeles waltl]
MRASLPGHCPDATTAAPTAPALQGHLAPGTYSEAANTGPAGVLENEMSGQLPVGAPRVKPANTSVELGPKHRGGPPLPETQELLIYAEKMFNGQEFSCTSHVRPLAPPRGARDSLHPWRRGGA